MSNTRYLTFPPGRLQQLLDTAEVSVTAFAERMDVSLFTANQWIQGKSKPHRTKLALFLNMFGLESELQLYDKEIAKKFTEGGLQSIGSGNADFGSLLVRLDGLAKSRMVFWETLRAVYANYIRGTGEKRWPAIQELADTAPPPLGLPLPDGEDLIDYPTRYSRSLKDSAAILYRFCAAVYPAHVDGLSLEECSMIAKKKFEPFHFARMDHAKVWNRIGNLVHDGSIDFKQILDKCPTASPLINLICYLEIALTQWTKNRGPGKVYLFRLNREWKSILANKGG